MKELPQQLVNVFRPSVGKRLLAYEKHVQQSPVCDTKVEAELVKEREGLNLGPFLKIAWSLAHVMNLISEIVNEGEVEQIDYPVSTYALKGRFISTSLDIPWSIGDRIEDRASIQKGK